MATSVSVVGEGQRRGRRGVWCVLRRSKSVTMYRRKLRGDSSRASAARRTEMNLIECSDLMQNVYINGISTSTVIGAQTSLGV